MASPVVGCRVAGRAQATPRGMSSHGTFAFGLRRYHHARAGVLARASQGGTRAIATLPGDGIGPEITAIARQLLDVVSQRHGFELVFEEQPMGGSAIDAAGEPLPAATLAACRAADAVLLAAIGSPRFDTLPREKRPESGLLALRAGMELFANLRPVKIVPALIGASSLRPERVTLSVLLNKHM